MIDPQHDHGRLARLHGHRCWRRRSSEGEDFDKAVQKLLTEIITEHGAVVFNGDGYSENWQIEAA